jgi:hypothetical protein
MKSRDLWKTALLGSQHLLVLPVSPSWSWSNCKDTDWSTLASLSRGQATILKVKRGQNAMPANSSWRGWRDSWSASHWLAA